jgi:SAM-dependent methyltransferase
MENSTLHFQEHDIRKVLCSNYFDYVFNLFTSFGYFKKESDDLKAIHMFSTALKKGGILLLDYINVAAFNSENSTETKSIQGIDFQIQKSNNANFIFKTRKFKDKGQDFEFQEEVKIIHLAKFKEYLSAQNLELIEVFGDYQLSPYLEDSSPRLILIARKK